MLAVLNFIPAFCPNCGAKVFRNHETAREWNEHKVTHFCPACTLEIQKADPDKLRELANEQAAGDPDPGELLACCDCGRQDAREAMHPAGPDRFWCDDCWDLYGRLLK